MIFVNKQLYDTINAVLWPTNSVTYTQACDWCFINYDNLAIMLTSHTSATTFAIHFDDQLSVRYTGTNVTYESLYFSSHSNFWQIISD